MHSISKIAVVAALLSVATAGDAPVVQNNPVGTTYTATIPGSADGKAISGAVIGAAAPDGKGTNFQISLYNLPSGGNLTYALHTGKVSKGDCSGAGAILDPYGGVTGSQCASNKASCQVGDLSDKYGDATILSGGSGTGYFPANYNDLYTSVQPGTEAFFGKGSVVIADSTGAAVACANFVNQVRLSANSNHTASSSSAMAGKTGSTTGSGSNGGSDSSSTSQGFAVRTAAPVVGAGLLGLAAMLI